MPSYNFPTQPVADADAVISGPNYRFTVINHVVLRYEWAHDGVFEDRASTFAVNRNFSERPKPLVTETEDTLEIATPSLHLIYDKKRFSPNGFHVEFKSKTTLWGAEWRYGEKPNENLGGTVRTLDGIDGRCDLGLGVLSKAGYSVIDDSETMLFDGSGFVAPRRVGDRVDGYIFSYGRDYKAAMKAFFAVSGHTPKLPRWALGNWWSRYHKYTADSYLALMDDFQDKQIPLSVAVIDMDWHLVSDERVPHAGWTGYTWDKKLFPDPVEFTDELHKRNLKVTLNDHPHGGIHHHEDQYEDMAKFLGHDTTNKAPIHFDPTSPKFMDAYFKILHRSVENQGCDFWWIDWQQGPFCRIPGIDPLWLLNHFQYLDHKEVLGDRGALAFSRYAGPGSHRYPIGFSGDVFISWESLAFQPEFTATASNIGYGWWSHDIGGHISTFRDDELATRWVQLGVFSPIMRLHSSNSFWSSKEPWKYRADAEQSMTYFMQFRHGMLPYLDTINANFTRQDEPPVKPLYWEFPMLEEAYRYPNQYYFGPSLLVAPIVQPRDLRTGHATVHVWLPPTPARYVDLFNGVVYDGGREMQLWRTLQAIPVLAPEGAIIPMEAAAEPSNGAFNPESLEIIVVVGRDGSFTLIEDTRDDIGAPAVGPEANPADFERLTQINWDQASGTLKVDNVAGRQWSFRFLSVLDETLDIIVTARGVAIEPEEVAVADSNDLFPGTVVQLPREAVGPITISIGPDPQLSVIDHTERIQDLLLAFQMEYHMKDRIYDIVTGSQPIQVKLGALLALDLDKGIIGPIMELLVADSRTK